MVRSLCDVILASGFALTFALAAGSPSNITLARRAVSESALNSFRGAILVKDGKQTSCEIALIDEKAGFVAANCLGKTSSDSIDAKVTYEVYFDNAQGSSPTKARINIADIYIHPAYNSESFANNIAVVKFTYPDSSSNWNSPIAAYRNEWTDIAYVRRLLTNVDDMSWRSPTIVSQLNSDPSCAQASGLYKNNPNDFVCSKASTASPIDSKCAMPYGSVYGVGKNSMGEAALYSHSVVYGNYMCEESSKFHYYTLLTNYVMYARAVLNRSVSQYVENTSALDGLGRSVKFQMKSPDAADDNNTRRFGGDMYTVENTVSGKVIWIIDVTTAPGAVSTSTRTDRITETRTVDQPSRSNDNESDVALASSGLDQSSSDVDQDSLNGLDGENDDTFSGVPKSTVIAMATAIPLAAIVLAIALYFIITRYQRNQQRKKWSRGSISRQKNVLALVDELGGASQPVVQMPGVQPPVYNEVQHSYLNRNSTLFADPTSAEIEYMNSLQFGGYDYSAGQMGNLAPVRPPANSAPFTHPPHFTP
ncbi:hypothetical protein LPJ66_006083 [Kickxella alabastrina]|uniref:Uncharacterized protein n=1 Tax=Kickxella alabastrina TaxID=61397 RepID=A0ACC1IF09_9FUNG|nr:hypothetical protein LPJ66_006083 [Kickxella alabastrina]